MPLTARSSDWRRKASWLEPNSTAMVLLPVRDNAAPEASVAAGPKVAGRAAGDAASESATLSDSARFGRYDSLRYSSAGGWRKPHACTHNVSPGAGSIRSRSKPRTRSIA